MTLGQLWQLGDQTSVLLKQLRRPSLSQQQVFTSLRRGWEEGFWPLPLLRIMTLNKRELCQPPAKHGQTVVAGTSLTKARDRQPIMSEFVSNVRGGFVSIGRGRGGSARGGRGAGQTTAAYSGRSSSVPLPTQRNSRPTPPGSDLELGQLLQRPLDEVLADPTLVTSLSMLLQQQGAGVQGPSLNGAAIKVVSHQGGRGDKCLKP